MSTVTSPPSTLTIDDATCTFCGCLCDDIVLSIERDRITKAGNACSLGEQWFIRHRNESGRACLIDGQPSSLDDAIERAAQILNAAKYPLVFGLCETTSDAQRAAVSTRRLGRCVR